MNLWEFIFYLARSDKSILQQLYGIKIFNKIHGYGVINEIDNESIHVSFDNKPNCRYKYKEFPHLFDNSFIDHLPISLKEKIKTKSSYLIKDQFIAIIFKIDGGDHLTVREIDFILERNAYELLGKYYEKNIADNKWFVVKAASYYRKAGFIDKAIKLTDINDIQHSQFSQHNDFNRYMAAVLTTHGACLRVNSNFLQAEKCALDALKYHISFYPYNLLGAIYIEQGKIKQGDDFFQKAELLGSDKQDEILNAQKSFIKDIIKKASKEEKIEIARYFYNKDRDRYSFLKQYFY